MAVAYSNDFRNYAVSLHLEKGMRMDEASKAVGVGIATYYRWVAIKKKTGKVDPKIQTRPGHSLKVLENEHDEFRKFLDNNRGKNAIELSKLWKRPMSPSTMTRWIKRVGYTLKKNNIYTKKEMKRNANNLQKKSQQLIKKQFTGLMKQA
jgi:transposase